jgi:hypothetical protein
VRHWAIVAATLLVTTLVTPAAAQGPPLSIGLDSGTVARIVWRSDSPEEVQLVAPLGPASDSVRTCHHPSSGCGPGSVNPVRTRSAGDVVRVEVHGRNHVRRGALIGAGVGLVFGLYANAMSGLSDGPPPSNGTRLLTVAGAMVIYSGLGALLGSGGHDWVPAP